MVASIGVIASSAQGTAYYERDGYYAKDDPAHREASAWAGKGSEARGPGRSGHLLEGRGPDGPQLGCRGPDGEFQHRPGRDVTLSAPKSVSLLAMVGGDDRIVNAHDRAVGKTLARIEEHAVRTRVQDKATGAIYRAGLAEGLRELGYGIGKTHADGRFEIAGVPRDVIEAFSNFRQE